MQQQQPPPPMQQAPPVQYQVGQAPAYPGQQTTVGVQQAPQVIYAAPPRSNRREKYPNKWGVWLGAILTTGGALCIILNIVGIAIDASAALASHGIWVGVLFLITGGLTIGAGKTKLAGLIISSMVMSIIGAVCSITVITTSAIGAAVQYDDDRRGSDTYYHRLYDDTYDDYEVDGGYHARVAVNIILAVCGAVCGLVCIAISIMACAGVCCRGSEGQPGRIITTQQGAQMIIISTNSQQGVDNPAMAHPGQVEAQLPTGVAYPKPPAYAPYMEPIPNEQVYDNVAGKY